MQGKHALTMSLLRNMRNYSQTDMSQLLGCSSVYVGMIERGQRKGSEEFWDKVRAEFRLSQRALDLLMSAFETNHKKVIGDYVIREVGRKFG